MPKGQLSRVTLARELLDLVQLSSWPSGTSAAPQHSYSLQLAISHSTSTSLHSICFMSSSVLSKRIFQSNKWLHQSTELTLEMVASYIK